MTYSVVNPEPKEVRQVPVSQMKALELGDVPDTTSGEELPRSRLRPVNRHRLRFKKQLKLRELIVHGCRR